MVSVKLFAAAAQAVGSRELQGDWAGLSARALLEQLQQQYPALTPLAGSLRFAVNEEYVDAHHQIADGDEVALIPPVSGGAPDPDATGANGEPLYVVTADPLSADQVAAKVVAPEFGAVVTFVGTVREWTFGQRTVSLEYEAYPQMARREMARIGEEIAAKWPGARCAISHRTGKLGISEASVIIAAATAHRAEAFEACRHAIERLKQIVPVWKKELWEDGESWVGAQDGRHSKAPDAAERNRPAST